MLVHLNVWNARVRDYPSRPIYGVGERSGIRLRKVVPTISWLLFKAFWWRLLAEVRDPRLPPARLLLRARRPHDACSGSGSGSRRSCCASRGNPITAATVVLVALLLIFGLQFTLFAMWFDMESNRDLGGRTAGAPTAEVKPLRRAVRSS